VRWVIDPLDGTTNYVYAIRPSPYPSPSRSTVALDRRRLRLVLDKLLQGSQWFGSFL